MFTVKELARILEGELIGSGDVVVSGLYTLEAAGENQVAFLDSPKEAAKLEKSRAAAFIVPEGVESQRTLIKVKNPRLAWAKAMEIFNHRPKPEGIHETAVIGQNVVLGDGVALGPYAVIGDNVTIGSGTKIGAHTCIGSNTVIGEDCLIHPQVTVEDGVTIGSRVILQAACVIGSDGFGFVTTRPGAHYKIQHLGGVVIEDDVEIGANVCIDRGTMGMTKVGAGTKIDNLVHLGHNDEVGEGCLLVAQVGISGSTKIGNRVTLAGQVGSAGHITIGDDVVVGAKGGITASIPPRSFYSGYPARNHRDNLKNEALVRKLPDLVAKIKELEKKIKELEK